MPPLNILAQRCAAQLGANGGRRMLVADCPVGALAGRRPAAGVSRSVTAFRGFLRAPVMTSLMPRWIAAAAEGDVPDAAEPGEVAVDGVRQSLVDGWPRLLSKLQAEGHFNMAEAEEAPEKLEERAQIKKSALEFARARRDIIYSLPADAIRPLAKFTAYEPNKKLNAALRRLDAQYVMGTPLPAGDGGEANFQDVFRVVMEMSYSPATHLATVPDETVEAALALMPSMLEAANAGPDEEGMAKADAAYALRIEGTGKNRFDEPGSERKQRMKPGDWECPACGGVNFSRRTECFRCEEAKPAGLPLAEDGLRRGDWICVECETHNYSDKTACRDCGVPRAQGDPNFGTAAAQMKPGEWMCPTCGINNFFYRTECYRCKDGRPSDYVPPPPGERPTRSQNMRPGDWECPECDAHNFARNKECFKCDAPRPAGVGGAGRQGVGRQFDMRPGDWMCPECESHNFSRNRECFTCSAPRPEGAGDSGGQRLSFRREREAPEMREGDWMCPDCNAHNFGSKTECFRCDCPRPESAGPPVTRGRREPSSSRSREPRSSGPGEVRPGDWDCRECGFHNYARNRECKRCDSPAPGPGDRGSGIKPANVDNLWNID
eukprot:jgi/Tetstr1/448017/TSEL_035318.t1